MSVRYCSESCQEHHWTVGGHRNECSKLRNLYNECVIVDVSFLTKGTTLCGASSFRKPSYVVMDETFTVKVETIDRQRKGGVLLHIYDRDKECEFYMQQDLEPTNLPSVVEKLLHKIQAEPSTAGTTAYLSAAFDQKGRCTIYLNRRKVKTW
jgi:MYND finger